MDHHSILTTQRRRPTLVRPLFAPPALRPPRIALSLPDALAHELNNPLSIAMMEAATLRAAGHDVESLEYALRRIQAVAAELRLPARLAQLACRHLELAQAFGIVQDLLGVYGERVELRLPHAVVSLEPLPLCHLLHAVLVSHLDTNSKARVLVRAEEKRGRLQVSITGGERSGRVRTSLLAVGLNDAGESDGESCHALVRRAAAALGIGCSLDMKPGKVETRFDLPLHMPPT